MNATNKILAALMRLHRVVDAGDWSKGKGSANNAGYMSIDINEAQAAMDAVEAALEELKSERDSDVAVVSAGTGHGAHQGYLIGLRGTV